MTKYDKAYTLSFEEVEERLQNYLDDKGLQLIYDEDCQFCTAESDTRFLDGSEVDECLAQILRVKSCTHWATINVVIVLIYEE